MKFVWPWQRKKQAELNSIEQALESIYTPVKANPAFNDDLRNRLVGAPEVIRNAGVSTLRLFMMIGGGLIGIVLFIFGIVRSVVALITGFRIVGDRRKATKTKSAAEKAQADS
mgnify:FL=1